MHHSRADSRSDHVFSMCFWSRNIIETAMETELIPDQIILLYRDSDGDGAQHYWSRPFSVQCFSKEMKRTEENPSSPIPLLLLCGGVRRMVVGVGEISDDSPVLLPQKSCPLHLVPHPSFFIQLPYYASAFKSEQIKAVFSFCSRTNTTRPDPANQGLGD